MLATTLTGCVSASPGAARDVPPYRSQQTLTPYSIGKIIVIGGSMSADRNAMKTTIDRVLRSSNFFARTSELGLARIEAEILQYSQPPMGSSFTTTLRVHYKVTLPGNVVLYEAELRDQGADDSGGFVGAQRAGRAKTLALANSIYSFRTELEGALIDHTAREHPSYLAGRGQGPAVNPANTGRRAFELEEVIVPPSSAPMPPMKDFVIGDTHALVIGNNEYANLPQLKTAVHDAEAISELLRDAYGYKVATLLNASRSDILSRMTKLRRDLGPNDNLLIYYAGHGWFDEDTRRGYWLPVDASADDPSNWVSAADVTDTLRAMQARHILVVADSCYSGALTRGITMVSRNNDYVRRLASKRARVVLTSGGIEPVEDAGGSGHSVFARAFLNVLSENDGVLEGVALFNSVRRPVMLSAEQTPEYGDIRFAGHEGGDFLFIRKTK